MFNLPIPTETLGSRLLPILERLAEKAWKGTNADTKGLFLLQPAELTVGTSAEELHAMLTTLYNHARRWAPGLDVPYFVPPIAVDAMGSVGGKFRLEDGYAAIFVDRDQLKASMAVPVVLAHEACHDILRQSQLNCPDDTERDELTTDLAMFVCGFGDLVLRGHARVQQTETGSETIHLGYLTTNEYGAAHEHTLTLRARQGLPGRIDLGTSPKPLPVILRTKQETEGAFEFACGEALCKRAFRASPTATRPWPIRCPECGTHLYPIDVLEHTPHNGLEPKHGELRLPRDGRLLECRLTTLREMLGPVVPPKPEARQPVVDGAELLNEMLEDLLKPPTVPQAAAPRTPAPPLGRCEATSKRSLVVWGGVAGVLIVLGLVAWILLGR